MGAVRHPQTVVQRGGRAAREGGGPGRRTSWHAAALLRLRGATGQEGAEGAACGGMGAQQLRHARGALLRTYAPRPHRPSPVSPA